MIKVKLPDGLDIEVASVTREMRSEKIGGSGSFFVQEPARHSDYFVTVVGGWIARPLRPVSGNE